MAKKAPGSDPVKRPGKRAARGKGHETEERLNHISTGLFVQVGFDKVSTRMIAEACDVTVMTIYLYFKDKRALYIRCCLTAFRKNSDRALKAANRGTTLPERIYLAIRSIAAVLIGDPHIAMLFQRELAASDLEVLDMLDRETFRAPLDMLQGLVDQSPDQPAPLGAISIYSLLFGLVQYRQLRTPVLDDMFGAGNSINRLSHHTIGTILPRTAALLEPEDYKRLDGIKVWRSRRMRHLSD